MFCNGDDRDDADNCYCYRCLLCELKYSNNTVHGILTQIIDLDRLQFSAKIKESMPDCLLFHSNGCLIGKTS